VRERGEKGGGAGAPPRGGARGGGGGGGFEGVEGEMEVKRVVSGWGERVFGDRAMRGDRGSLWLT
jgi:hypothetical protein